MWTTNAVLFLCLLAVAVTAPTKKQYEMFRYSTSVEVKNREESKLECSITLPAGGKLKWYRERSDTKELVEVVDDYWKREHGAEYMITDSLDKKHHYYMSKLAIRITKESYAGIYFCVAEDNNGTNLTESNGIRLTVLGVDKECQEPHITGYTASWIEDRNHTNVQWTIEPPLKSDWCRGNKLIWSIRYCVWDSIEAVPQDLSTIHPDSDAWSKWISLGKRQTQINITNLDKKKYYLFEIGRRIKHKDYIEHKYPSKIHYFGQQVGARVIQAKDVQVKVGLDATITCIADGVPEPKVIWTVALGDSSPTINSQTSLDIVPIAPVAKQFSIKQIANIHEKKYTCLARNTIIKDGVKTRIIDTATIKLEVLDNLID